MHSKKLETHLPMSSDNVLAMGMLYKLLVDWGMSETEAKNFVMETFFTRKGVFLENSDGRT
jgi:hypothetical protein